METFDYKKWVWMGGMVALFAIAFAALVFGLTTWKTANLPAGQVPIITVTGEGEVAAVPDIATVSFTVREVAKTVPEAQKLVEEKIARVLTDLAVLSIDQKDTKTSSYSVYPKYEFQNIYCITTPCPSGKNELVGYEVAQTITVKVRNVATSGDVIAAIGNANITEISGPEFTVDDIEELRAEAKEEAIKQAEEKAKKTAKSLGVSLGALVSFGEDQGGYAPMYYARDMAASYGKGGSLETVTLPEGESLIKVRVTLTYALR